VKTPWSDWRPGVGTSWRACPLSRAWHGAVTRDDNRARQCADRAAHEWNRVIYRGPLAWLCRAPRPRVRFSADDYATITGAVATLALERTLVHIEILRRRRRGSLTLAAVALLERVETAVAMEVDRRLDRRWPELPGHVSVR
jgi:hypothetical protein